MIGYVYGSNILSIKLINNTNKSNIMSKSNSVSGILGYIYAEKAELNISNNTNKGIISGNTSISGIVGNLAKIGSANIENNINDGKIIGASKTGGIIGEIYGGKTISILSNVNNANIEESKLDTGGIIGNIGYVSSKIDIIDCHNKGNIIQSRACTAGILGYIGGCEKLNIKDSDNEGEINCIDNGYAVGGIIGRAGGPYDIYNCYNKCNVTVDGGYHVGGIVGESQGYSNTVEKCYNLGNITSNKQIGGIIGGTSGTKILKCYNTGNLEANNEIGGISSDADSGYSTVTNCYNTGKIVVLGSETYKWIGGIESGLGASITKCYNTGEIIIKSVNNNGYIGGIAGYKPGNLENTYNLGNITIVDGTCAQTGSIVGLINSIDNITNNAYLTGTYGKGMGGDNEDSDTTTKQIENIEDLYTLINENLTEEDGWILEEGEELPTINFEEE